MNIQLKPGKYVLAVSGGVDSVVLLDLLSGIENIELLIVHFDHGIRQNSKADRLFVSQLAAQYSWPFFYDEGRLGHDASEAEARAARYKFLRSIKNKTGADAIITAHHQDDVIETAIINLLRGTRARGLGALKSTDEIIRPLLGVSKQQIISYAQKHKLQWHEDPTNRDQKYLRNHVRLNIVTKMNARQKSDLLNFISKSSRTTEDIDTAISSLVSKRDEFRRQDFVVLPHVVACELVASWLRQNDLEVDERTVQRLVVSLKAGRNGSKIDINKNFQFLIIAGIIRIQKSDKF